MWVNGDTSIGNFVEGQQEGLGKKIFKSGDEYTGEFKGSFFNGKGKYIDADGTVYEGEFKNEVFNVSFFWFLSTFLGF